ncbi:N-acetylglucosaminyldiphosphodolichol N-acetylglucosaminyltransferase catalytic subunit alg13 [Orbilia oligospora]|nr:N-acetylglucosaminyldiphosphodolichol N-acetylglucosaminyltransferase catalytic subunit alg13 [Orbilia oligospora]KAF3271210.1 N-acetylglucosaminyldiphosphodolichol N-acetylglucosaminyltransferase catalytic subunit alg13 [Orbilia oligospora]KAF3271760.1 N-acetylglucosaminyldiphosphodolichol N-acetylglucosaminyltransferase catalytic subunit alg13 [Orbilia oligospora]KAF3293652.1 N-acetylglucosaminyldiphosphodolichol N-acetylglucosaminyltransferase catalytic subunit alg13 [Orbilia oligospora]
MASKYSKTGKGIFITVGTTAFDDLITALLIPGIITQLHGLGFNEIRVQYGKGKDVYDAAFTPEFKSTVKEAGMSIAGFEYEESSRITEFIKEADLIISHAGSGTILDALRYQKAIIVVPNESLMDNHQAELASEMSKQKYVIRGKLDQFAENIAQAQCYKFKHFPRTGSKKFVEVLEDEIEKAEKDKMYGEG